MSVVKMPTAAVSARKTHTRITDFEKYENGRKRKLVFNANRLADFEQETGMGFAQMLNQKALFAAARGMLFAGLKTDDRTMTIDKAGELLSMYISDEDFESSEHGINDILGVLIDAAVSQGALGKMKKAADVEDEDELELAKPDMAKGALTGTVVSEDPNETSAGPTPTT